MNPQIWSTDDARGSGLSDWIEAICEAFLTMLNDGFHEAALDPAEAARRLGVSGRYLHMLFAEAGTTFCNERTAIRLDRAAKLLADARFDGLPVSEIAWRCGFKDPSHFARPFRRRFGRAPLAHRKGRALTGADSFAAGRAPAGRCS